MSAIIDASKTIIKICGIKDPNIAYETAQLGIPYIGIMFHEDSKRYVNLEMAKDIAKSVKEGGAKSVGVFVNQNASEIVNICDKCDLQIVQLHGDIARETHKKLPDDMTRIYVLHINDEGDPINDDDKLLDALDPERDFLLFDGVRGGSGKTILTHHLSEIAGKFRYFLAGGLNLHNIKKAIRLCQPYGVDLSSGVEDDFGKKRIDKIKNIVEEVRYE